MTNLNLGWCFFLYPNCYVFHYLFMSPNKAIFIYDKSKPVFLYTKHRYKCRNLRIQNCEVL